MKPKDAAFPSPLPRVARFEELAFGLFVHWGLYSLLGRGEWIRLRTPGCHPDYPALIREFTADGFDASAYVRLAKDAGMRYITFATRHHEGFSLYDTQGLSDFDVMHSPAGRDLVREFVDACRAGGIVPMFYHTTLDWHWRGLNTATCTEAEFAEYLDYLYASIELLCTQYGEIGGFWFDGDWSRKHADWQHDRFYGRIANTSPRRSLSTIPGFGRWGRALTPRSTPLLSSGTG